MVEFIHISDLHFAPLPPVSVRQLLNKRLIGYINWRVNRRAAMQSDAFSALARDIKQRHYQHLVVSGDLVNLALPREFANAREKLSALGDAHDVSVVFGNHDAYVPGAFARACRSFAPWIAGDKKNAAQQGARQEQPYAGSRKRQRSLPHFPYMRVRGNCAFIGVSTAAAMPPFCAAGIFGKRQASALAKLLREAGAQNLFRVVIMHHPPIYGAAAWHKALWGIKRLQQVLAEEGAELVLHGHTHLPSLSYLRGKADSANPQGKIAVVGVASAAQGFGGHKPPAGYNLFAAEKNNSGQWQCRLQRFALADANGAVACFEDKFLLE